jgi:hypothetical protein
MHRVGAKSGAVAWVAKAGSNIVTKFPASIAIGSGVILTLPGTAMPLLCGTTAAGPDWGYQHCYNNGTDQVAVPESQGLNFAPGSVGGSVVFIIPSDRLDAAVSRLVYVDYSLPAANIIKPIVEGFTSFYERDLLHPQEKTGGFR